MYARGPGGSAAAPAAVEGGEDAFARLMATRTALTAEQVALFDHLFPHIMAKHFDAVWGASRRWGVGEADAYDVTQEVFASFLVGVRAEGLPESIPAKLVGLAVGKARNYVRDGRREQLGLPSSGSMVPGSAPDLARHLDHEEFRRRILLSLSPDQITVIDAVFLQEQTQAEAADGLGMPRTTLSSRLHKMMPELQALAEAFFSESERR